MLLFAEVTAQAQQVQNVPTALVAVITVVITTVGSVLVAYIYKRGEGRTSKSDNVPELMKIMDARNNDLQNRIEALVEDRDAWRAIAWRQVNESETATDDAFVTRRINREVHVEPDK